MVVRGVGEGWLPGDADGLGELEAGFERIPVGWRDAVDAEARADEEQGGGEGLRGGEFGDAEKGFFGDVEAVACHEDFEACAGVLLGQGSVVGG